MTSVASDTAVKSPPIPAARTSPPPIIWHEMHSDPLLDVVLKSSDTPCVYFRASSNALKRESSLYSGMLTSLPNTHQTASDAIPLDFPASAITVFLDGCTSTTRLDCRDLPFDTTHQLRKLVHYLDCDRLTRDVNAAYAGACRLHPISMLETSSREGDILAGMQALKLCTDFAQTIASSQFLPLLSNTAKGWRLALAQCLLYEEPSEYLSVWWPSDGLIKEFGMTLDAEAQAEGKAALGIRQDWVWDEDAGFVPRAESI